MKFRFGILTALLILGLTNCSSLTRGLYGMKKLKKVNEETIIHYAKKYKIPQADLYVLDTSYLTFLFSLDTAKYKEQIKNHYQPLQALYYERNGQLKSFQINCYAGGFPNLKWNRNNTFETFPPRKQAMIDSIVPLELQIKYINPLSQTKSSSIENYDYIVIVYWNRLMGRQSKRLIGFVQENHKLAGEKKVKIIYVNTDNIYTEKDIK